MKMLRWLDQEFQSRQHEQTAKFQGKLPSWIFVARYAPFSTLLQQTRGFVHYGGMGTT